MASEEKRQMGFTRITSFPKIEMYDQIAASRSKMAKMTLHRQQAMRKANFSANTMPKSSFS